MSSVFDAALERSQVLDRFRDQPSAIRVLARQLSRTEEEIEELIHPRWFSAQVLWTSATTATLSTTIDGPRERQLVFLLNRRRKPTVVFNKLEFEPFPFDDHCKHPPKGARIVFRFNKKTTELLARYTKSFESFDMRIGFMHSIEWCREGDYNRAKEQASACPEYRLVCKRHRNGKPVADPINRRWHTPVHIDEEQQWRGCDLNALREFLTCHHYTRYDHPTYQQRLDGHWVDCQCPLG